MVRASRAASAVKMMVMEGTRGGYWNIWSFHGRIYGVLVRLQGALEISTAEFRIAGREKRRGKSHFYRKRNVVEHKSRTSGEALVDSHQEPHIQSEKLLNF